MANGEVIVAAPGLRKKFLFLLLYTNLVLRAQLPYGRIDQAVNSIPREYEKSIESITRFIEQNSQTELEKARGAFCWIANNVKYDVRKYVRDKPSNYEPEKVFRKRKAVCAGYSNLYLEMCRQMNLPCEMVSGYSKGIYYKKGQVLNESDHVWNAVKADTLWRLLDVTWGAGDIKTLGFFKVYKKKYNDRYFNLKPQEFLLDHLPEVPMWQLLDHPVPLKAFADDNRLFDELKKQKSPYFNFVDSITTFRNKDSSVMALDFGKMAIRFNSHNPIPLAYGMLKNVEDNIVKKTYSAETNNRVIDSMIFFTENSIKLFKKAKSSSKSVKERLEANINMAYHILAQLQTVRAAYFETILLQQNTFTYDSLKYISDRITKSLLIAIRIYKSEHLKRLLKASEERYCSASVNLYNSFSDLEQKETDVKKKKMIKKQAHQIILLARMNLSYPSDCRKTVYNLRE